MKVWIYLIWRTQNHQKKTLNISSESGFWIHSKNARLFFRFKHTSGFCQENRSFCIFHHWLFTNFFLSWKKNDSVCRRGSRKLNKSLISDGKYIESMKKHICETLCLWNNQHITGEHLRWEYLKYKIHKFTKKTCKSRS